MAQALACGFLLLASAFAADAQEWRVLFDGKTFDGWRGKNGTEVPRDFWTIDDGCLRTIPNEASRDIFTANSFRDFELSLEWKVSAGGNSGVFYNLYDGPWPPLATRWFHEMARKWMGWHLAVLVGISLAWVQFKPRLRAVAATLVALTLASAAWHGWRLWEIRQGMDRTALGLEMQILDDARHPDGARGPKYRAGALYDQVPASRDVVQPAGEWNEARVIVNGSHVEHWLNGEKVVEFDLGTREFDELTAQSKFREIGPAWGQKRATPIALQHHHDLVWFRNIKIRPL